MPIRFPIGRSKRFAFPDERTFRMQAVPLERIHKLRWQVLRAGMPPETAVFEEDSLPTTFHMATMPEDVHGLAGPAVCCASFTLTDFKNMPAMQLRGMATAPEYRSLGLGGRLLAWTEKDILAKVPINLWCNARVPAIPFYEKQGWHCISEVFEIPTAGPHRAMVKVREA